MRHLAENLVEEGWEKIVLEATEDIAWARFKGTLDGSPWELVITVVRSKLADTHYFVAISRRLK